MGLLSPINFKRIIITSNLSYRSLIIELQVRIVRVLTCANRPMQLQTDRIETYVRNHLSAHRSIGLIPAL